MTLLNSALWVESALQGCRCYTEMAGVCREKTMPPVLVLVSGTAWQNATVCQSCGYKLSVPRQLTSVNTLLPLKHKKHHSTTSLPHHEHCEALL